MSPLPYTASLEEQVLRRAEEHLRRPMVEASATMIPSKGPSKGDRELYDECSGGTYFLRTGRSQPSVATPVHGENASELPSLEGQARSGYFVEVVPVAPPPGVEAQTLLEKVSMSRAFLITKLYMMGTLSKEETSRLAILDVRLEELSPRVPAELRNAVDSMQQEEVARKQRLQALWDSVRGPGSAGR